MVPGFSIQIITLNGAGLPQHRNARLERYGRCTRIVQILKIEGRNAQSFGHVVWSVMRRGSGGIGG